MCICVFVFQLYLSWFSLISRSYVHFCIIMMGGQYEEHSLRCHQWNHLKALLGASYMYKYIVILHVHVQCACNVAGGILHVHCYLLGASYMYIVHCWRHLTCTSTLLGASYMHIAHYWRYLTCTLLGASYMYMYIAWGILHVLVHCWGHPTCTLLGASHVYIARGILSS